MTERPLFVTLTPGLARELIEALTAVLSGDLDYMHVELPVDGDPMLQVGLHFGGDTDG